jgi:hypothetical protein
MYYKQFTADKNIRPNYWDFIGKKLFTLHGAVKDRNIDTYLIPLWIISAVKLILEDSNLVLHKAGNWFDFGVYTKSRIESAYVGVALKRREEPSQDIILEKLRIDSTTSKG